MPPITKQVSLSLFRENPKHLPGVADMYTIWIYTWNTLLESYHQRVYKITLPTVKLQVRQAENPKPAKVISTEAAHADSAILLDY